MPNNDTNTLTLPSGLAAAVRTRPASATEYIGVVVRTGSRNDPADRPGLAHFVEHTIFKGTHRRRAWHILNCMETRGGELNAYTTKEETVIYTAAPAGNAARALDLLADLVINSRFPVSELEKERQVVADEIDSYLDNPAEAVFDDFDELLFDGTRLSHNILGNAEALSTFSSADCREFLSRWYRPDNMALFYDGPLAAARVERMAAKAFVWPEITTSEAHPSEALAQAPAFDMRRHTDSHQCHTIVGTRIPGMYSPDRFALSLINNILGGPCMNSRLNLALRERRGLVYSVDSSLALYTDCGALSIYFGCDSADLTRCRRLIADELLRLSDEALAPTRLRRAVDQYTGQLTLGAESREQTAIGSARSLLYYGRPSSLTATVERLRALTPADIAQVAAGLRTTSALTLG